MKQVITMLNHIVIMGRLTRDPELRYTQSRVPVASFTVAVDRDYQGEGGDRQTDFIDCTAWRGAAELIAKHFTKGRMIVVSGRLQSRKWEDRDGNKRTAWEINAESVYFGDSKRTDSANGTPAPGSFEQAQSQASAFQAINDGDDGELPF